MKIRKKIRTNENQERQKNTRKEMRTNEIQDKNENQEENKSRQIKIRRE